MMIRQCSSLLFLILTTFSAALPLGENTNLVPADLDIALSAISGASIDNIDQVLDTLIQSGGKVKDVIVKLSNNEIVQELVEEVEEIILRLQQGVSKINQQHKTYAGEALKDMLHIKVLLKTSRLSLNELAKRTVLAVQDLKAFSEALFTNSSEEIYGIGGIVDLRTEQVSVDEKMEYVKEQITIMKNLIRDTKTKVEEVKLIYADVKVRMTTLEENLVSYKLMVEHLLRNETNFGGTHAINARAGVYTSAGVSTTACIVADVLGAMGICSGINAAVVVGSTITLEVALAKMRANLETLHKDGEIVIIDVQQLRATQDELEDYLDREEQVLVFWVVALDSVESKLTNPKRLFLRSLPVIQKR